MITVKDLHMQQTVKVAVEYAVGTGDFADLRKRFNALCQYWNADEFEPGELSLDVNDIARHIDDEPWIRDIAAMPAHERTWKMTERVVEGFILKYWLDLLKDEVTVQMVADVLRVADPLSRRHILAQRVVIESMHELSIGDVMRLDEAMDQLATNPRLEEEYIV